MNVSLSLSLTLAPSVQYRYGIIKHHPEGRAYVNSSQFIPDTIPVQDGPARDDKGIQITIFNSWWEHIHRLNPGEKEYGYTRSIGNLWVNNVDTDPYYRAEAISIGGNFVAFDRIENGHGHMQAMDYRVAPTDPNHNWYNHPWLYFKALATNISGQFINVGQGWDVYYPNLYVTDRWINVFPTFKHNGVELFPELPYTISSGTVVGYRLQGASVIGILENGTEVYLLKSTRPGERVMPYGWHLDTVGVIPPA